MTVIDSRTDAESRTLTFVAEFDAPVERVWDLWADPRKLERFWGPPGWPATFHRHEFEVGGAARYRMNGPDGESSGGWWRFTRIEAPTLLEFDDGFSGEDGEPAPSSPAIHARVELEDLGSGTRMTVTSHFDTVAEMEQLVGMGMQEGMRLALGQIDAILAEQPAG